MVRRVQVCVAAGNSRVVAVLDAADLVVLLPGVGLKRLGRGQETENRRVPRRETSAGKGLWRIRQQPSCAHSRCPDRCPFEQERTPAAQLRGLFGCFHGFSFSNCPCLREGECARKRASCGGARGTGREGRAKKDSPKGIATVLRRY